ncbi:isopeptide-forming domain-containing fimbrial protein [Enterococcus sp. DIV0242_7C1]|uniref:DUF11 domain-containing protein n=1 Tax=Candidatus Enterococcus dunnyi TaxID=1834192 RepID=A0A200J712_9ENTE|nr:MULTISPECIES: isopeptide-forming domain-containing fimbrial protein [unclassified Enterococcus]MBO0472055.1 isopeptide-forming domain-containing fimbrial protein [Enterococcus sp. DIV0242_7C1]OUZ32958.1 hypothetical protein A5889_001667 [Enterococcus sp. 9D6_DIV0238]
MKIRKQFYLIASMLVVFSFLGFFVSNKQTKIKASEELSGSYVLEKKTETENQVTFDLKVTDPQQGTVTLKLSDTKEPVLYAEDILENLNSGELEKRVEIKDSGLNQVSITFKDKEGTLVIPIALKVTENNKKISDMLKVLNGEQILSESSVELTYQEVEKEPVPIARASEMISPMAATVVTTWDQFKAALENPDVDVIDVGADFARTATTTASGLGTLARDVTINGNGHTIDFGNNAGYLTLGATSTNKLVVNDLTVKKAGATAIFYSSSNSAIWDITFNNVNTPENNESGVIDATNSTLTLAGNNTMYAKNNTVTILHVFSSNGAVSDINTNQSANTLTVWAIAVNDGNRGGGSINLDNATLKAHSTGSSAVRLRYGGNKFIVTNNSKLVAITDRTTGDAATVRFSTTNPDNEFQISNNSVIDIQHLDGDAPALRLNGDGFITNVSGKSKLNLYNKGSGSASNTANEALNLPGANNTFTIRDADSQVNMIADFGPAVYGGANTSKIDAGPGTEFIARGNTSGAAYGVFNMGSNASVVIDNPIYYDFANTRSGGANIFSLSGSGGTFIANNTDVSVWEKGKSVYVDDPIYDWTLIDFTLTGSNLATISTASDPDFKSLFGAPNNYSRMSGNNARPIVDELRQPTNADKKIYGHVSVPEGVEGIRDAWTDEVDVDVKVKNADGTVAYETLTGDTVGAPGLKIWGETERNGMFEIELPDGKFLKTGQTIEVTAARRQGANSASGKMHESLPEDIQTTVLTVIDVTPPTQAVVSSAVNNAAKQIKGTSDEDGAKVFVKVNGEWLKDSAGNAVTTTVAGGNWTIDLPSYIDKTAQVEVYLKDTTEITPLPSFVLPRTYTVEPDGVAGNLNEVATTYDSYTGYHDAVKGTTDERFDPATLDTVADVIPDAPKLVKGVESSGGSTTSVGDTLTYSLLVSNTKVDSYDWTNVEISDVLAEGLEFDPAKHKVTIDNVEVGTDKYNYNETTRTLTIKVGDLSKPGPKSESDPTIVPKEVRVTFQVNVGQNAVDEDIQNTATAVGYSPQEDPFEVGPIKPDASHVPINVTSNTVGTPGGPPFGILSFVSAPTALDFGIKTESLNGNTVAVNPDVVGDQLVVSDNRGNLQKWTMTATLLSPLSNGDAIFPDALHYVNGESDEVITGLAKPIFVHTNANVGEYNISEEEWVKKDNGFKIELAPGAVNKLGKYQATIQFSLEDTP